MIYKQLSSEELKALEKDFIAFLAHAQITGPDWEKMKQNELAKAEELIDVFSDVVYDKVLKKIKFLEYREPKSLHIYKCNNDNIELVGLKVNEHSNLNLTAENVFEQWNANNNASVTIVKSKRDYIKEREMEVFELLQTGCLITDDKLFTVLSKLN
ncbi:MAG: hypothetical protein JNL69_03175 [Bacteroidia bacterium]|nr:hypothetical protein [Bacteroidia bacterium]